MILEGTRVYLTHVDTGRVRAEVTLARGRPGDPPPHPPDLTVVDDRGASWCSTWRTGRYGGICGCIGRRHPSTYENGQMRRDLRASQVPTPLSAPPPAPPADPPSPRRASGGRGSPIRRGRKEQPAFLAVSASIQVSPTRRRLSGGRRGARRGGEDRRVGLAGGEAVAAQDLPEEGRGPDRPGSCGRGPRPCSTGAPAGSAGQDVSISSIPG